MAPTIQVNLINEVPGYPAPGKHIQAVLDVAIAQYGQEDAEVNLLLVEDATMRQMNQRHAGHEGTTDVLAFDDGDVDPESGRVLLGDVAVCVGTARRVAKEKHLRVRDEVALYALHGVLHLLGYRDHTPEGRAEMNRLQRSVFDELTLPYCME